MRYRIKALKESVIIKINGKAREDEATRALQALSAFLRHPGTKAILYLAGLRELAKGFLKGEIVLHFEGRRYVIPPNGGLGARSSSHEKCNMAVTRT